MVVKQELDQKQGSQNIGTPTNIIHITKEKEEYVLKASA
jgi:hypothetical protein